MDGRLAGFSKSLVSRRGFIAQGASLAAWAAFEGLIAGGRRAEAAPRYGPPEWLSDVRAIADGIRSPRIPQRERRLGPVEGDSRPIIQAAIDELAQAGGGRVALAAGEWRVNGPLRLLTGIELHVDSEAQVVFSGEPLHYLPLVHTRWEGTELFGYSPCIYAYQASDLALTGRGTLSMDMDGGVRSWRREQDQAQKRLRQQGAAGAPLHERVYSEGSFLRPSFIQFFGCQNVRVEDVSIRSVPFWCVHFVFSHHVHVRGVSVESSLVNNDGIDVDSSTDVVVERCHFRTGDDCVAIKSGRDFDGRRRGAPSQRIVIRDCFMERSRSAGVAIGSEMSGGVRQVYIIRCRMGKVDTVLNVKSNLDRGGVIEQVRLWNVTAEHAEQVVQITTSYHGYVGGNYPPLFRDFQLEDIRCGEATTGVLVQGVAAAPVERVLLRDLVVDKVKTPRSIKYTTNLSWEGVVMNGLPLA